MLYILNRLKSIYLILISLVISTIMYYTGVEEMSIFLVLPILLMCILSAIVLTYMRNKFKIPNEIKNKTFYNKIKYSWKETSNWLLFNNIFMFITVIVGIYIDFNIFSFILSGLWWFYIFYNAHATDKFMYDLDNAINKEL